MSVHGEGGNDSDFPFRLEYALDSMEANDPDASFSQEITKSATKLFWRAVQEQLKILSDPAAFNLVKPQARSVYDGLLYIALETIAVVIHPWEGLKSSFYILAQAVLITAMAAILPFNILHDVGIGMGIGKLLRAKKPAQDTDTNYNNIEVVSQEEPIYATVQSSSKPKPTNMLLEKLGFTVKEAKQENLVKLVKVAGSEKLRLVPEELAKYIHEKGLISKTDMILKKMERDDQSLPQVSKIQLLVAHIRQELYPHRSMISKFFHRKDLAKVTAFSNPLFSLPPAGYSGVGHSARPSGDNTRQPPYVYSPDRKSLYARLQRTPEVVYGRLDRKPAVFNLECLLGASTDERLGPKNIRSTPGFDPSRGVTLGNIITWVAKTIDCDERSLQERVGLSSAEPIYASVEPVDKVGVQKSTVADLSPLLQKVLKLYVATQEEDGASASINKISESDSLLSIVGKSLCHGISIKSFSNYEEVKRNAAETLEKVADNDPEIANQARTLAQANEIIRDSGQKQQTRTGSGPGSRPGSRPGRP